MASGGRLMRCVDAGPSADARFWLVAYGAHHKYGAIYCSTEKECVIFLTHEYRAIYGPVCGYELL